MKKSSFICCCLILSSITILAQNTIDRRQVKQERKHKFMVGIAFDAIKTDFTDRLGNKIQGGLEVNYFIEPNYSLTLGMEAWAGDSTLISGVAGIRVYAFKSLFLRARGLIGADDISVGTGFQKMISEQWTVEGIVDYYFEGQVAARIGLAFLLVKRRGLQH